MKKTTKVKRHFRKTRRGPKIVRQHNRMMRAKMAEWSSPEEREQVQKELKRLRENEGIRSDSWAERGFRMGEKLGYEKALRDSDLLKFYGSEEVKPFKRAHMRKLRTDFPEDVQAMEEINKKEKIIGRKLKPSELKEIYDEYNIYEEPNEWED